MPGSKIERIYAWIVTEPDGGDGRPAVRGLALPLISTHRGVVEKFRGQALEIQRRTRFPVRLVYFETWVELERLSDG
jgi:hypothetical protein